MNIPQEIAKQVEQLPPAMQAHVLRFVESLTSATHQGEPGSALRQFSRTLDSVSSQQMREAIESECEHVDASQW